MPRRTLLAALIALGALSALVAAVWAVTADEAATAEDLPPTSVPGTSAAPSTSASAALDPTTASAPPSTTEAPPTTTTQPPPPTTPPPPPIEEGDLVAGVQGERTRALQDALVAQGYDPGEPDGRFGGKTTMAVWAFQALHGLPVDGVVTAEVEAAVAAASPQAMLRPDLGPTHTEVDLDRQVLLVWRDGQLRLITHVSTGTGESYCEDGHCGVAVTPVGDYRFQRRIEGERKAPLGTLYDPVYFNGGIAVHGAPSVPAHPASHGCVRIPMHISSTFQGLVDDGDPISTFHGGQGPSGAVAPEASATAPPPPGAENGG